MRDLMFSQRGCCRYVIQCQWVSVTLVPLSTVRHSSRPIVDSLKLKVKALRALETTQRNFPRGLDVKRQLC